MFAEEVFIMALDSILTILFSILATGLLIFGYLNEEKVIDFEDKIILKIKHTVISAVRKSSAARRAEAVPAHRKAVGVRTEPSHRSPRRKVRTRTNSGRAA